MDKLLKIKFELSTLFIALQSQKKWSKSDRNNVHFLPVTATHSIVTCIVGHTMQASTHSAILCKSSNGRHAYVCVWA